MIFCIKIIFSNNRLCIYTSDDFSINAEINNILLIMIFFNEKKAIKSYHMHCNNYYQYSILL